MVVVIEDITDQAPAPEAPEEQPAQPEASEAANNASAQAQESEDWVKVEAKDAVSPKAGDEGGLESLGNEAEEVDPEVFAAQLATADALKSEGNTLFAEGNMEEAIDKYTEALEEAPISAPLQRAIYFSNRAACHMRLEEYSEAAIDCSAALDLHPTYVKALVRRASAFEAINDYEAALTDLRKVVELEPQNKAAIASIARVEPLAEKKRDEMKEEMIGKLKDLGNTLLGKFGMSIDNFKTEKDPATGSYSIKFQQ